MGLIGGEVGYQLLRRIAPRGGSGARMDGSAYRGQSKLRVLLGDELLAKVPGKTVIDFGCGTGEQSIELAELGAESVIGVDIQERFLEIGRANAAHRGLTNQIQFVSRVSTAADLIVSLDSFEHFENPAHVLQEMRSMLSPGGQVLTSFGPTWYHPLGGHLFSVFPWAHLVFTERALLRWRADFKDDGAQSFREVAGGLNQMTIRRFRQLVRRAGFRDFRIIPVPIRGLRILHNRMTEEFTTAIVRAQLTA